MFVPFAMGVEAVPFVTRVIALAVLMAGVASLDLVRHRRRASRWKEYLFLWVVAGVAALCGAANDSWTVRISPDYFVVGKGLPAAGVWVGAVELGARAGFSAGAVAAALCLFVASAGRRYPVLGVPGLARLVWRPLLTTPVVAVLLFTARDGLQSLEVVHDLAEVIGPERTMAFVRVWAIHGGMYAGLAVGLVWMMVAIVRSRMSRPRVSPGS